MRLMVLSWIRRRSGIIRVSIERGGLMKDESQRIKLWKFSFGVILVLVVVFCCVSLCFGFWKCAFFGVCFCLFRYQHFKQGLTDSSDKTSREW